MKGEASKRSCDDPQLFEGWVLLLSDQTLARLASLGIAQLGSSIEPLKERR